MPDAKTAAISALTAASGRRPVEKRLSATTIRAVVDIAWKHQFEPSDRAPSRRELKEVLAAEFLRARKDHS